MFGLTPYNRRNRGIKRSTASIIDEMDAMVENFFGNSMLSMFSSNIQQMKVNIKDNDLEYIVEADLPGVNKDDMNVELNNNTLTISVKRNEETREENENYIRQEKHYGSMTRSFYVENIKDDEVKADYNNGILSIKLPKASQNKPKGKRIDIN